MHFKNALRNIASIPFFRKKTVPADHAKTANTQTS